LGRRLTEWELKGVPVRVEIGPRDLAEGNAMVARRDLQERTATPLAGLEGAIERLLDDIQASLAREATERVEQATQDVTDLDEALEAAQIGFARVPWSALGEEGERLLNREAVSVRCLQTRHGDVPANADDESLLAIVGRAY
jgi:prolyl-tRNA synthetase